MQNSGGIGEGSERKEDGIGSQVGGDRKKRKLNRKKKIRSKIKKVEQVL